MPLVDILARGFFPKELPNPFVTTSFARVVTSSATSQPSGFHYNPRNPSSIIGKSIKYSHSRGGLLRRQLSIPNPILYYLLCNEIDSNWTALQPHISGTTLSATNPVFKTVGRAIQSARPQDARLELALKTRLNNKYILRTDISRFYHSIYTHTFPWALHTKAAAKANRKMNLLGNRLDCLVRNGQDGQTVGIPIGPDTSLVLAEILMQKCDTELLSVYPSLRGHRFIDDYELGFRHRTEAEEAFQHLEKILADYELALNPSKTEIIELPCLMEAPWIRPLRSFDFRATASGQLADLYRFFDLAFEYHRKFPNDTVLQFAVGRLWNISVEPSNWELFQLLLLNCVVPEPATLPYVLEAIINRVNNGCIPARPEIEQVLNSLIIDHSALGHSSEVAWALWACLALGINISSRAVSEVSKCSDSVVALLALHCEKRSLAQDPLDHTLWLTYMNQESLYDEHWLLAYEAYIKGWLPSQNGNDYIANDPNFQFLKTSGVAFYDERKAIPITPGGPAPVPSLPTPPKVADGTY